MEYGGEDGEPPSLAAFPLLAGSGLMTSPSLDSFLPEVRPRFTPSRCSRCGCVQV